jgi:hypothetical protein
MPVTITSQANHAYYDVNGKYNTVPGGIPVQLVQGEETLDASNVPEPIVAQHTGSYPPVYPTPTYPQGATLNHVTNPGQSN